jgi:hypothetical protein
MRTGRVVGAAGVLALAVAAGSAFGQLQVQQGNALDANPQVGSGGSNTPVQGYVPINGNDIITGNVSGLKYFHGPAGTVSPYTFQGNLGTSTLQNFARQSAGGVPTTPTGGLNSVYYLPSSTVSTAQGSLYSAPATGGFDSRLVPTSSLAPTAGVNGHVSEPVVAGLQLRQFDVGNSSNPNPASGNGPITSPLFGLRPQEAPAPAAAPLQSGRAGPGDRGTSSPADQANDAGNRNTGDQDNGANGGTTGGANGNAAERDRGSSRVNTGVPRPGQEGGTAEERTMRVTGAYATLLDQLRRARGGSEGTGLTANSERNVSARTGEVVTPAGGNSGGREGARGTAVARGGSGGTSPLVGGAGDMGLGSANGAGGASAFQSTDPTKPNYRAVLTERPPVGVAALAGTSKEVLQAGRQLGELPSLSARPGAGGATPAAPAFEQLMMRGEERLKDGKYLEAADAYQQAITAQPNNALAVLGRGHAELAAGMYQSAASDLQFVFTKKPELVSVKYALGNYLPLDRQVFLMNDLLKLSRGQDTGNMGSFLLCYLCYQTGRGAELKAELDRWAARPWKNDWQTVAEKAWR